MVKRALAVWRALAMYVRPYSVSGYMLSLLTAILEWGKTKILVFKMQTTESECRLLESVGFSRGPFRSA